MKKVAIIMGSISDWNIMKEACLILDALEVSYHQEIVSAHRTPDKMFDFAKTAKSQGYNIIIAGAGGAAHLPGMVASLTTLPVVGVPIQSISLQGLDSLLSIVQMPFGVPVATMAINNARNAALFAAAVLALQDDALSMRLDAFRKKHAKDAVDNQALTLE